MKRVSVFVWLLCESSIYYQLFFFFLLSLFDFQNTFKNHNWMFAPAMLLVFGSSLFLLNRFHTAEFASVKGVFFAFWRIPPSPRSAPRGQLDGVWCGRAAARHEGPRARLQRWGFMRFWLQAYTRNGFFQNRSSKIPTAISMAAFSGCWILAWAEFHLYLFFNLAILMPDWGNWLL